MRRELLAVMANLHWVPLTSLVITSTRIQRANNLGSSKHHLIDCNIKKFGYNEHPAITSTFSCIKVLVVSGTQCTLSETNRTRYKRRVQCDSSSVATNSRIQRSILLSWLSTSESQEWLSTSESQEVH